MSLIQMNTISKKFFVFLIFFILLLCWEYRYLLNSHFQFDYYYDETSLYSALITKFPLGSTREHIENDLLSADNIKSYFSRSNGPEYFVVYAEANKEAGCYWEIHRFMIMCVGHKMAQFRYDENDKLLDINVQLLSGKSGIKFFSGHKIKKGEKL